MSWRVGDVMSEMWPEAVENLTAFEGRSAGLNASRDAAPTRAVLWVAPTFIAIGREKPGVGHRVVVERFAVSEIVSVAEDEETTHGREATPARTGTAGPLGRLAGRSRSAGRLVIRTRRGDIDFTAGPHRRGSTRRAYHAIAALTGRH